MATRDGQAVDSDGAMTIDDLARATGLSVRNIREHQARGLLPPPEVRRRTGYYGDEHLARVQLIKQLQADGFNLKGIKRLLEDANGVTDRVLGLRRAVHDFASAESSEVITRKELTSRFGEDPQDDSLQRAVKLGALVPLGGDRYEVPSPSLLAAAEEVVGRGVPLPEAISVLEEISRRSESVARRFISMFMKEVWKPFAEEGYPEQRWGEVIESVERMRPVASHALLAVFQQTMTRAVEEAFGKELARYSKRR